MNKPNDGDSGSSRIIMILYGFFAAMWTLGLVLGIREGVGQAMIGGLPLWFSISCIGAYVVISVVLAWAVRRYFQ